MKTFNLETNMKTQAQFSAGALAMTPAMVREVLECGSPLPLWNRPASTESARGLAQSKTLARWPQRVALLWLLLLAWLALPGRALAQPSSYTNDTVVANYVNGMLYWSANSTSNNVAAFRYLTLLYTNTGSVAPALTNMANLYGNAERALAQTAASYVVYGLTNNPSSTLLAGLLLDIYYDRTAAEFILTANSLNTADVLRMGPPSVAGGLVIDDEIGLYQQVLSADASALMWYFSLLSDNLDMTNAPPEGYQWFQQLAPSRSLAPASYLSNGVPTSVTGDTNVLFTGYKDLVLLFNGLRDYGRAAVTLAQLQWMRNNPGDLAAAKSLIADSQRFLFLETSTLLAIFPGLDPNDTNEVDAASGLAEGVNGVNQSLGALETMRQTIVGGNNVLGFASDFLMLVQQFAGQTEADSFDAFQLQLNPSNLSSPLSYALTLLAEEVSTYDQYQSSQDQLNLQLENVTESADDRLFQIVGAEPGTPAYNTPTNNVGGEIWQQVQSIQVAQLRIQENQVEMSNLIQAVQIEVARSAQVANVTIQFANEQASLTEEISYVQAGQDAASAVADAFNSVSWWGAGADAVNAAVQATCDVEKGQLEAEKEQQAGLEDATIEGINSAAQVQTMLLKMNTLAVDSQEAAVLLEQQIGQLVALYSEKADLEQTLAENQQNLAQRYFADPIHHLRYQEATLLANLSFNEAQQWLFYMVRALEYKWNTPFANYSYLGRSWSTGTLFELRNATELQEFYNAMVSFDSLVQLPNETYPDWFSVRDNFFGYQPTNSLGQVQYYPDPMNPTGPTNLTGIQAFQQMLRSLTNAEGDIQLEFNTVREIPGGTFFLGPRFDNQGNLLDPGLCLDKINYMCINLPGNHTLGRTTLAGNLTYGGTSFIRNFNVGTFVPGAPNLMTNEMTAYSTRYWFFDPVTASWQFSAALQSAVTMQLSTNSMVVPTAQGMQITIFQERSVATTGWLLSIPTQDLGVPVLNIDELDDVEIYFYHNAVSRQVAE